MYRVQGIGYRVRDSGWWEATGAERGDMDAATGVARLRRERVRERERERARESERERAREKESERER